MIDMGRYGVLVIIYPNTQPSEIGAYITTPLIATPGIDLRFSFSGFGV